MLWVPWCSLLQGRTNDDLHVFSHSLGDLWILQYFSIRRTRHRRVGLWRHRNSVSLLHCIRSVVSSLNLLYVYFTLVFCLHQQQEKHNFHDTIVWIHTILLRMRLAHLFSFGRQSPSVLMCSVWFVGYLGDGRVFSLYFFHCHCK